MVFLLKCAACIALVLYVLQWRAPDPAPPAPSSVAAERQKPSRRPQIGQTAKEWTQAGADALASAARDKCLSNPRECAALLQRLQGAATTARDVR